MNRFPIKFSGPISPDTQMLLEEFIGILIGNCNIARAQAKKFKDIDWRTGVFIDKLPGLFRVEMGSGSFQHQSNLYFRSVLIAKNIGVAQTEIYLEDLKSVIQQHEKRGRIDFTSKIKKLEPEIPVEIQISSSYVAALNEMLHAQYDINFYMDQTTEIANPDASATETSESAIQPTLGDCLKNTYAEYSDEEYDDCDVGLATPK